VKVTIGDHAYIIDAADISFHQNGSIESCCLVDQDKLVVGEMTYVLKIIINLLSFTIMGKLNL